MSIEGVEARHLARVLRLRPGDTVTVCDGTGQEYQTVLTVVSDRACHGVIRAARRGPADPRVRVCLFASLSKGDKMDMVVQKCTELGVAVIRPVISERSVARPEPEKEASKSRRWERIAREAAKQSGRASYPVVFPVATLEQALDDAGVPKLLVPWEGARGSLQEALGGCRAWVGAGAAGTTHGCHLGIVIGPEGGLTGGEVSIVERHGGVAISLGPRILRTETACIAAVALALYVLGELEPVDTKEWSPCE